MTNHRSSLKPRNLRSILIFLLLSILICGCQRNTPQRIGTGQPSLQPAAPKVAPQSVATTAEVNEAVTRVFKDAVSLDSEHNPNFVTGDFNGDSSVDVAVILKPAAGKLDEMNQQSPPWILRDPFATSKPAATQMKIAGNEPLLAVIHGYGARGWRDSQATQTYLLRNSVGREMSTRTRTEVVNASQGKPIPRLVGDSIAELLRGQNGYLFFNGAQYAWYDPKTFKGEAETRLAHQGMSSNPNKVDLLHPKLVAAEK